MDIIKIMVASLLVTALSGCMNTPASPSLPQDLMSPPCKLSQAGKDTDADLQSDVENAECVRTLRLNTYRWQAWYRASQ